VYTAPDDGQKTSPKHAEFYSKNKFEKLVHLVGFSIRIYHDTRSSECQTAVAHRQTMSVIQGPDGAILKGPQAGETCRRVLALENA